MTVGGEGDYCFSLELVRLVMPVYHIYFQPL